MSGKRGGKRRRGGVLGSNSHPSMMESLCANSRRSIYFAPPQIFDPPISWPPRCVLAGGGGPVGAPGALLADGARGTCMCTKETWISLGTEGSDGTQRKDAVSPIIAGLPLPRPLVLPTRKSFARSASAQHRRSHNPRNREMRISLFVHADMR